MATTTRLGTFSCMILGALAVASVAACSASSSSATGGSGGTSSGGTSSGGSSGGSSGSSGGAPTVVNVTEVEPNNGPDMAGAQNLGAITATETIVIKGELSSGGFDGTKYTGDWDLFALDVGAGGALDVSVDWTSSADVDVAIYDASLQQKAGDGTQAKPAVAKVPSVSGKMLVALFSKDTAAPYTLTITFTKPATTNPPPGGGTCPTTPIVPAMHSGGCAIDTTTPVCAVADLTGGKTFELDWTTNQTFCEGPHKIQISGDPPSDANSVFFSIASTYSGNDASMVRNIGGYMKITANDIAPLTSSTGIYYYGVASFGGSRSEGRAFTVIK